MSNFCNYQGSNLSDSLSHPSEAPDIRNWFSSYAYESPELNTYKDWEDSSLIVNDSEEDTVDGETRKHVRIEKKLEGTTRNKDKLDPDDVDSSRKYKDASQDCPYSEPSEVLGSLSNSLSDSLEPPHIGRWFSSYVYESPSLDTCIRFAGSESQCVQLGARCYANNCSEVNESNLGNLKSVPESYIFPTDEKVLPLGMDECRNSLKEGAVDAGETRKQVGQETKFQGTTRNKDNLDPDYIVSVTKYTDASQDCAYTEPSEVLGSLSDSLPLSSEPPHIGRWFSSYLYESPSLDTCIGFTGSESQCAQFGGRNYANNSLEVNESIKGNLRSVPEKCILATDEKVLPFGMDACSNSLEDTNSQLQCTGKATTAAAVNRSDLTDLHMPCTKIPELLLKEKPIENHNIDSTHLRKRDLDGEDFISREPLNNASSSKSKNPQQKVAQKSGFSQYPALKENLVNITSERADKKSKEISAQENGFVSTKKKISETKSAACTFKRSVELPLVREHVPKRKPFSEMTNFQRNDVSEITGKWKCPRKNNPNRGPPLKQLRLEQWVNRM